MEKQAWYRNEELVNLTGYKGKLHAYVNDIEMSLMEHIACTTWTGEKL